MNKKEGADFFNRELSWLEFNERVLEEAHDKTNPLMERLKFLAITASNLDEFFMVRVSVIWEQSFAGAGQDAAGYTPLRLLSAIGARAHEMSLKQYDCFNRSLLPAMKREGIHFLNYGSLDEYQRLYVNSYYDRIVYPVLTPMAIDRLRPFPVLNNKTINIFIELESEAEDGQPMFAVAQVPTILPRLLELTSEKEGHFFILLEDIMLEHLGGLFPGHNVLRSSLLRVTRNSDLAIDDEDVDDMRHFMELSIKKRRKGDPVRLEITDGFGDQALAFLTKSLELETDEVYKVEGPLDLSAFMVFLDSSGFARLRNKPLPPGKHEAFVECGSIFEAIRERDVLVHHPYMSFDCVVDFVREAAADPDVLAIKQTLYRVSGESPVLDALIQAADGGKQVTVLVELRARFDEENNINWAKKLEQSGCHVVYGLTGLKTHCKICLVVRREEDGIRRYVHLGTGNYNEKTAKIYTDTGYFTCKETFGQDCSVLFNVLTGYSKNTDWQKISVAPVTLRQTFARLIESEAANAREGKPASITAKMNSLSDVEIIRALYDASRAGVKINLLVRGICCLKAGIPGLSENIEVSSIVDRFLEHDRIYIFENGGSKRVYLSSADWMPRNLERRVEILFPIEDADLKNDLIEYLEISLSDNVKRRVQRPDGTYAKQTARGRGKIRAQHEFYERVNEKYGNAREKKRRSVFEN